jgi:GNAT superfamily N-acetyltransferase
METSLTHEPFEARRGGFTISTDRSKLDLEIIHSFLRESYWAKGIPREIVARSIENSLCFGVFAEGKQLGFARVISDYATYAYIADVFILESHRGHGLGKWLMEQIMSHPQLQGLRRWSLCTRDAHGLYEQAGFTAPRSPQNYMERLDSEVYQRAHSQEIHLER